jgi:hypothetical protein
LEIAEHLQVLTRAYLAEKRLSPIRVIRVGKAASVRQAVENLWKAALLAHVGACLSCLRRYASVRLSLVVPERRQPSQPTSNDPPWPGCNKAVDEFTSFTPEKPQMIERNNYQKWYLQKISK